MKPYLFLVALSASAIAASAEHPAAREGQGAVLAELFTSQSCSSCPPAEALFSRLADDPALVTLEWHVDYWDRLVYGQYGAWKDPFSDPVFTERQRKYNAQIRGTRSVYTPQAVIGGTAETSGARGQQIRKLAEEVSPSDVALRFSQLEEKLSVSVGSAAPAEVWVAYFIREVENHVPRGENHGRVLSGRHVVEKVVTLGKTGPSGTRFVLEPPIKGMGCAVIVQEPGPGAVYAAAYCPN